MRVADNGIRFGGSKVSRCRRANQRAITALITICTIIYIM